YWNNMASSPVFSFTTLAHLSTAAEVAAAVAAGGGGGSTFRSNVCQYQPSLALTDLAVTAGTGGTATVTWKTDFDAISLIRFGIETVDEREKWLVGFLKDHSLTLSGIIPSQNYKLRATSVDKCGNVTTSDEITFTLPGEEVPPPEEHAAAPEEPASSSSSSSSLSPEEAKAESILAIQQALGLVKSLSKTMSLIDLKQTLLAQNEAVQEVLEGIPGPVLSGEPKVSVTESTATVTWTSNEPANSIVAVSPDEEFRDGTYVYEVGDALARTVDHEVTLTGLKPGGTYHFQVKSATQIGTSTASRDFTFETPAIHAKVDNYSSSVLSPESAVFRWQTNVETSSRLTLLPYREGEPQSSEAVTFSDTAFTTTHDLTADSLEPGTVYEVEIAGRTAGGTDVSQIIPRFATTEHSLAPSLSRVKADVAISPGKDASAQVIITWETDKRATGRVRYRQGVATDPTIPMVSVTPLSTGFGRTHTVILAGLTPGTVFSFQAESVDDEGRIGLSKVFTILTPRKQESISQVISRGFGGAFGWIGRFRQ
ncbi:MAG: fibronectin type III domain-containing protein, partial [Candidatus Peribacteraceae bacterium]|nr:fibronectin type III domain-containing protein [Candidatus Peribacteraceae bacterium]